MEEFTLEIKELAKAAAAAYVTGLRLTDVEESVDHFVDAYDYALKKFWLRDHKERAMKDIVSGALENSSIE